MNFRWWFSRRREPLADFADAIRGELGEMRVPPADDTLLNRIRESRRTGARVILPLDDARRRRLPIVALSAVAAAAVAVFLMGRAMRESRVPVSGTDSWFASDVAFAGTPQASRYAAARVTRADRLRPMSLRYARTLRDSTGTHTYETRMAVTRDAVGAENAWRTVVARQRPGGVAEVDSLWVSAATLSPLKQVIVNTPYRRYERLAVWQNFSGLTVRGEMKAFLAGELSAHRTFDRALSPDFAPYLPDAFAPLYLMGVDIDRAWTGRVGLLGWAVRDDDVFVSVDLRVAGEDTVRVPAGTFPCWRLEVTYGTHSQLHWVRKSDGLGVRVLDTMDPRAAREIVLASERVDPQ